MKTQVPITSILGTQARDFTSYVGWLKNNERNDIIGWYHKNSPSLSSIENGNVAITATFGTLVEHVHDILTIQNIDIEKLVGKSPIFKEEWDVHYDKTEYMDEDGSYRNIVLNRLDEEITTIKFESHKPNIYLKEGNVWRNIGKTLNDFLIQIKGLEYNDKYMIEI